MAGNKKSSKSKPVRIVKGHSPVIPTDAVMPPVKPPAPSSSPKNTEPKGKAKQ